MKQKVLIILFFAFLSSCEDKIFDRSADPFNGKDKAAEIQSLLDGAYFSLSEVFTLDYFNLVTKGDDITIGYYVYKFPSDPPQIKESYNVFEDTACGYNSRSGTHFPRISDVKAEVYKNLYRTITTLNYIIFQYAGAMNENGYKEYIGEALLLRGYCYFLAVRIFGEVPLILDSKITTQSPVADFKEIYEAIVNDLKAAEEYLPAKPGDSQLYPKPLTGAAKALLAEVYITMAGYPLYDESKYALSAQKAREVIDQAQTYNYDLAYDFQNLFDSEHKYNHENVLSIYCERKKGEGDDLVISNHLGEVGTSYPMINWINSGYSPEFNFYNNYPVNYRKRVTFTTRQFGLESDCVNDHTYYSSENYFEILTSEDMCDHYSAVFYKKWLDFQVLTGHFNHVGSNYSNTLYLLRYAHVLLTYAEASARSGKITPMSYEALNMIRRRANLLDPYSPSKFDINPEISDRQFIDSVVCERAWEFAQEPEGRWFDIIRLDMEDQVIKNRHAEEVKKYNPSESYFYDIPLDHEYLH